jgi:hypothetical protein
MLKYNDFAARFDSSMRRCRIILENSHVRE